MVTTTLVFVRQEGTAPETLAIINVTTKGQTSYETVLEKLKKAVTDWVKHTTSGKECWESSGSDLNIGDLAQYEQQFLKEGLPFLKKQGIVTINFVHIGEIVATIPFDQPLFKE